MLSYCFLLIFVLLSPAVQASESRIVFPDSSHDFGRVYRGQILKWGFSFKNEGDEPLMVTGVHAACGCITSQLDPEKIYRPGDSGIIDVSFDSKNFAGRIDKTLTVITNEKKMPTKSLIVKMDILENFSATPPVIDFGEVQAGSLTEKSFKIINHKKVLWLDAVPRFNDQLLVVTKSLFNDHGDLTVTVRINSKVAAGILKDIITVKIPDPYLAEIPILVRAQVLGALSLESAYVEFGSVTKSRSVQRQIKIRRTIPDYRVERATAELHINGTRVEKVSDYVVTKVGNDQIELSLANHANLNGSVHGKILLDTNDPVQKRLSFDFYAFFTNDVK